MTNVQNYHADESKSKSMESFIINDWEMARDFWDNVK